MKLTIIYWSGTGNTEAMANYIKEGAESAGASVTLKNVSEATDQDVDSCDVLALGCPSMGSEMLEEGEFEPFLDSIEGKLSGKPLALFGSYDWGDGEWMRNWYDRMESSGAKLLEEGLIVNNTPEGSDIDDCKEFGKKIGTK